MPVRATVAIEAYIGASGSGKGVSIGRRLAELQPKRLLIWDPRDEYERNARAVRSLAELADAMARAGPGPIRVRYVPPGSVKLSDAFGFVCAVAFAGRDLVFVAEELSDVTTPSYAPPQWRRITTQGRHRGLHVLGAAQRPTLIDKTFLGNCSMVTCFQLGYDSDVEHMAKELRCRPEDVGGLVTRDTDGGADIRGLQYERRTRELWALRILVGARGARETRTRYVVPAPQTARRRGAPT